MAVSIYNCVSTEITWAGFYWSGLLVYGIKSPILIDHTY